MSQKVLIAGGGIGGMAAALALIRQGIDVEIYEQAQAFREVGAGVQISPNGNRALDALGVFADLRALSCDADEKQIRLWNTGATWKLFDLGTEAEARYGYPYLTVFRPDLLKVLSDAVHKLRPDALHLECRVKGVSQDQGKVTLHLENGTDVIGDALIGADGVHTRVRAALWGDAKAQFSGMMAWRGVIPMDRLPDHMKRHIATNWIGPGSHVVCYPLRRGELLNFVGTVQRSDWQTESWSTEGTREDCAADFKGWHAVPQALAAGVAQTGCTVHVATEALDDGPILAQRRVAVLASDDESSLHERIKEVERALYPEVISRVMAALDDGRDVESVAREMEEA